MLRNGGLPGLERGQVLDARQQGPERAVILDVNRQSQPNACAASWRLACVHPVNKIRWPDVFRSEERRSVWPESG